MAVWYSTELLRKRTFADVALVRNSKMFGVALNSDAFDDDE